MKTMITKDRSNKIGRQVKMELKGERQGIEAGKGRNLPEGE